MQRFDVCGGRSFHRRAAVALCLVSALVLIGAPQVRMDARSLAAGPSQSSSSHAGSGNGASDQKSDGKPAADGKKTAADDDPVTETVYNIGGDVTAPRVLRRVMPEFTEKSRERHIEGSVVLATIVTSAGEAHQIHVQKSLDKELDQKAVEALRQWQFQPGQKDNKPVATRVSIEIRFNVL